MSRASSRTCAERSHHRTTTQLRPTHHNFSEVTHDVFPREAPEISKDPVADSSDLYAFVSPDNPSTVTIIANYVPLQQPPGGPNFDEFGNDVLYQICIDNDGDGNADISIEFQFHDTAHRQGPNDIIPVQHRARSST